MLILKIELKEDIVLLTSDGQIKLSFKKRKQDRALAICLDMPFEVVAERRKRAEGKYKDKPCSPTEPLTTLSQTSSKPSDGFPLSRIRPHAPHAKRSGERPTSKSSGS